MPSEQEILHHRTFLSLHMCRTIYNEDERHQYNPGGVPNRQAKIDSDPVFKYHVRSCPRYPQRAPGQPTDRQYYALLTRDDGSFEPLEIIPKRDQRFESVATQWERTNSVLCSGGSGFNPVVNSAMEVTGHSALVRAEDLIRPKGINFEDIADYIKNEVPIYLWMSRVFDVSSNTFQNASGIKIPPGWEAIPSKELKGGVSVLVLPNGKVIAARGHRFTANNGHAIPTVSPLDFWTPGTRLVAGAIRGLTNRAGAAVKAGFQFLKGPTKELAELSAARLAGKALPGMSVPTTGLLPADVLHVGRRTLIMGEDMAHFRTVLARSHSEQGFYDVMVHGDDTGFAIVVGKKTNGDKIYREVSVREVANTIRPHLRPGDQIRLLSCETGACRVGPAQQLANELKYHDVWAPTKVLPGGPRPPTSEITNLPTSAIRRTFRPEDGGTFSRFSPIHRGAGSLVGPGGGKVTGDFLSGEIPHAK